MSTRHSSSFRCAFSTRAQDTVMRSGYVRDSVRDNGVFLALRMAEPCLFSRSFGFCITPTPSTRSAIVPSTSTSASLFMRQVKEGARPSGGCRTSTMPTATCRELRARRCVTTGYMLSPLNGRLPKFEHGSADYISISSILAYDSRARLTVSCKNPVRSCSSGFTFCLSPDARVPSFGCD